MLNIISLLNYKLFTIVSIIADSPPIKNLSNKLAQRSNKSGVLFRIAVNKDRIVSQNNIYRTQSSSG